MDAQQRLLLERSFEALAIAPVAANAQRTAVFVGIGTVDYVTMSAHLGVGMYVASGAIHYPLMPSGEPVIHRPCEACLVGPSASEC
jgi:acyl transferase domain-containing protein